MSTFSPSLPLYLLSSSILFDPGVFFPPFACKLFFFFCRGELDGVDSFNFSLFSSFQNTWIRYR